MNPITITDPALLEQLRHADGTELRDPDGRVLGEFTACDAVPPRSHAELFRLLEVGQELRLPPGTKSPITEEDRRENRKQLDGRPLSDILRDLERLA